VIGRTDKQGGEPDGRSVHILDLQATIYELMGIDHTKDHKVEPGGRLVPILKRTARSVPELIG
jgi:arylsulfatase A-like enzyme